MLCLCTGVYAPLFARRENKPGLAWVRFRSLPQRAPSPHSLPHGLRWKERAGSLQRPKSDRGCLPKMPSSAGKSKPVVLQGVGAAKGLGRKRGWRYSFESGERSLLGGVDRNGWGLRPRIHTKHSSLAWSGGPFLMELHVRTVRVLPQPRTAAGQVGSRKRVYPERRQKPCGG